MRLARVRIFRLFCRTEAGDMPLHWIINDERLDTDSDFPWLDLAGVSNGDNGDKIDNKCIGMIGIDTSPTACIVAT